MNLSARLDLPFYYSTPLTLTEAGVPYIVSIFAENAAGNGTKCNVTDFTDELGEFHCCTKQHSYVFAVYCTAGLWWGKIFVASYDQLYYRKFLWVKFFWHASKQT